MLLIVAQVWAQDPSSSAAISKIRNEVDVRKVDDARSEGGVPGKFCTSLNERETGTKGAGYGEGEEAYT